MARKVTPVGFSVPSELTASRPAVPFSQTVKHAGESSVSMSTPPRDSPGRPGMPRPSPPQSSSPSAPVPGTSTPPIAAFPSRGPPPRPAYFNSSSPMRGPQLYSNGPPHSTPSPRPDVGSAQSSQALVPSQSSIASPGKRPDAPPGTAGSSSTPQPKVAVRDYSPSSPALSTSSPQSPAVRYSPYPQDVGGPRPRPPSGPPPGFAGQSIAAGPRPSHTPTPSPLSATPAKSSHLDRATPARRGSISSDDEGDSVSIVSATPDAPPVATVAGVSLLRGWRAMAAQEIRNRDEVAGNASSAAHAVPASSNNNSRTSVEPVTNTPVGPGTTVGIASDWRQTSNDAA